MSKPRDEHTAGLAFYVVGQVTKRVVKLLFSVSRKASEIEEQAAYHREIVKLAVIGRHAEQTRVHVVKRVYLSYDRVELVK